MVIDCEAFPELKLSVDARSLRGLAGPPRDWRFVDWTFENRFVNDAGDSGADNRGNPEEPELLKGPSAHEHGSRGAACRIDRGVRHWNADQVDQRESKPDAATARSCVVPRMTIRNMNVITTSETSPAVIEYPPGECMS
jgi:hypothetical protein